MNCIQAQLIDLLSCALRGKKASRMQLEDINWKELLKYADSHQVNGLIHSTISNTDYITNMDQETLQEWKKKTFLTAAAQIQHIRQIEVILRELNEKKIQVIGLKGLVIRELYPHPELRTMRDADILVKKNDLNKVKNILECFGYDEAEASPVHITYNKKNSNPIEVHWTIEDNRFFKEKYELEDEMWDCAIKVKIGESEVLSFSAEDLALHLCIHMAVHILTSGFGIRQLCDLVLLVEKKGHLINWESFYRKGKDLGIQKFIIIIFLLCKKIFQVTIPEELYKYSTVEDSRVINSLIGDIISGGVYGKRDMSNVFANEFAYGLEEQYGGNMKGVLKRFLYFIFPPTSRMSDRYAYAKKCKGFIPLAWVHHLISGIMHSQYGFFEKAKFFLSSIFISIKRHKLLKRLEL